MADEPKGWHLSERGLQAILALCAVATLFIQSWFAQRDVRQRLEAVQASVEELKRPVVYGK